MQANVTKLRAYPVLGALMLAIAGCPAAQQPLPPTTILAPAATGVPTPPPAAIPGTPLTGRVVAPRGIVAAGGGNLISKGGAGIVAAGGGNIVAAGGGNIVAGGGLNFSLLADESPSPVPVEVSPIPVATVESPSSVVTEASTGPVVAEASTVPVVAEASTVPVVATESPLAASAKDETPLVGAKVVLADAAGNPYPAIEPVITDADGRYKFPSVPADFTYVVAVEAETDNKPAILQTLAHPTALGATADVSAASTCVTVAIVEGQDGTLGEVNPLVFQRAVKATQTSLTASGWPDLSDRQAIIGVMADLVTRIGELKDAMDQLRQQISRLSDSIDRLSATVDELRKAQTGGQTGVPNGATPPPAVVAAPPTPTPVPSPTPTPIPYGAGDLPSQDTYGTFYTFDVAMDLFDPKDHTKPLAGAVLLVSATYSPLNAITAAQATWTADDQGHVNGRLLAYDPSTTVRANTTRAYDKQYYLVLRTAAGDKVIGYVDLHGSRFDGDVEFVMDFHASYDGPDYAYIPKPRFTKFTLKGPVSAAL